MPIKAIVNGVEKEITRIPVLGHDIETATGTNSITFNTSSDRIIEYDILGNTQQTGTPAPDAPIMPTFCGEKSANLFDKSNADIYDNSTLATQNLWDYSPEYTGRVLRIPCNASTQYTISFNQELSNASLYRISILDTDSVPTSGETGAIPCYTYYTNNVPITRTITTGVSAKYILLQINGQMMDSMCNALMINEGAIPLPYEPYGYKIPITCAGQTVPIYLGQTQTVRRVKKLVLTGEENVALQTINDYGIANYKLLVSQDENGVFSPPQNVVSTHFAYQNSLIADTQTDGIYVNGQQSIFVRINRTTAPTVTAFKTWLATQYAAGTPVTVWYVLATPETAIVNEPLSKIGTYADELHSEDAAVTIPTTKGQNTLSIGTTLSPSSTEVTYLGIKNTYKEGWEIRDQQDRLIWGKNNTLTGVSPISFRGYGIPLKSIKIVGNTQQNGTPAPDAPIIPEFVGERTGNLFDGVYPQIDTTAKYKPIFVGDGDFTLSTTCTRTTANTANIFFLAGNVSSGVSTNDNGVWNGNDRTVTAVDGYVTIAYRRYSVGGTADPLAADTMLNSGSTPLPYEPYGYKIPITCAGQTVPIYLGQTQTVRRVKKLVLTGQENWIQQSAASGIRFNLYVAGAKQSDKGAVASICTHFPLAFTGGTYASDYTYTINNAERLYIRMDATTTLNSFKSWLADQYSAGTPVTVWYVLAEPETGIVNEPLCKIGDYADELTTDPNITPQTGTNTLAVDTTLSPSLVSITGHIKETV